MSDSTNPPSGAGAASRKLRRLPDLSTLLGEETKATDSAVNQPQPARPRRAFDLSRLDEIIAPPVPEQAESAAPPVKSTEYQATPVRKSTLSGLDALYSEEKEAEPAGLLIPPELEQYLSPDLWRRLSSPNPARGVLINALERARSTLFQLSTFIPQHLVQDKMRRSVPGLVSGQILRGTLLFSDVSGFTALSERLATLGKEGAEILTGIMNKYFTRMLEILEKSGGILLKFAGDATLVYFPEQENGKQANWAVRSGLRMLHAMSEFSHLETPSASANQKSSEKVNLRMKIGVASGEFLAASVGSTERMEYAILGDAVRRTMAAEGASTAGSQLIADKATTACLEADFSCSEHKPGFTLISQAQEESLDDFEIQAEKRRARGAIPWSASPQAIRSQIEVALRQIQSLTPYLPAELVDQVAHTRTRHVGGMYRRTAVLFANFTGFEALLDAWGAEAVTRVTGLLSAYFNAMQSVIARYGGVVSRIDPYSKGTKLLALFGAPVAHEDDPQRAVSAALAMNIELEDLNETWQKKFSRRLPSSFSGALVQHRIGVTYGDTYAGQVGSTTRREYTVMGDDVNLAARLMGAASMGQVLISQRACEAVADTFVLTALTPMRVKGKSKPVAVYQVDGPRDDTLVKRMHGRGELFGREAELAQADQILAKVFQGEGEVLTIQGPAGIGKSHLADEIMKRAAGKGAHVELIQCRAFALENPYAAWSSLLRSLAGVTASDYLPQVHQAKLASLASRLDLPKSCLPWLTTLMGLKVTRSEQERVQSYDGILSPDEPVNAPLSELLGQRKTRRKGSQLDIWGQLEEHEHSATGQVWQPVPTNLSEWERRDLHEAVRRMLAGASRKTPLAVFFEDAQWMDAPSRSLVEELGNKIKALPVLLLFAQRSEVEQHQTLGGTISLGPLSEAKTTEMVAHLLVYDIARVIHEQSNGNPLFVDEITRWFQRSHHINAAELRSVLESSDFLLQLVLSGLESLPKEQQEIAKAAAVLGNEFRTGEAQALLAESIDPVSLSNHLRGLVRARILTLVEAGADARYTFQPAYVREILYNSLPFEGRRELHSKAAAYLSLPLTRRGLVQRRIDAALQARSGSEAETAAQHEAVVYHLEQAQDWLSAANRLFQAGKQASEERSIPRAIACYNRALADLERLPPENIVEEALVIKSRTQTGLGDAALLNGDFSTALTAFEAALASLPAAATGDEQRSLIYRLALVLPTQRRAEEAEQRMTQSMQTPSGAVEQAHTALMAWLTWRAGKPDVSLWIEQCRSLLAPPEDNWALGVQALLCDFQGDCPQALRDYERLRKPAGQALIQLRWGTECLSEGDHSGALEHYRRVVDLSRGEDKDVSCLAISLYLQAEAMWCLQDLTGSQASLEEAANLINKLPAAQQAAGQTSLRQALKLVRAQKGKRWPVWNYQWFDDAFRISLLFRKGV